MCAPDEQVACQKRFGAGIPDAVRSLVLRHSPNVGDEHERSICQGTEQLGATIQNTPEGSTAKCFFGLAARFSRAVSRGRVGETPAARLVEGP